MSVQALVCPNRTILLMTMLLLILYCITPYKFILLKPIFRVCATVCALILTDIFDSEIQPLGFYNFLTYYLTNSLKLFGFFIHTSISNVENQIITYNCVAAALWHWFGSPNPQNLSIQKMHCEKTFLPLAVCAPLIGFMLLIAHIIKAL